MQFSLRLIVSLILGVVLVACVFADYQVRVEKRGLRNDLEKRAEILAESLEETVTPLLLEKRSRKELQRIVERFGNHERLAGMAVFDERGETLAVTPGLDGSLRSKQPLVTQAISKDLEQRDYFSFDKTYMYLYVLPLKWDSKVVGALAILHDASYIQAATTELWRHTLVWVLVQVLLIVLITLLIVRWSVVGPIAKTARWLRELRMARTSKPAYLPKEGLFKPLAQEVAHIARSLEAARAAAEEEARLREAGESLWTAERLRVHVRSKLEESPLFVVSNREPYVHVRHGKSVEAIVPASGLVTALEPILRACDGTWIAHGSGEADWEMVDERGRLRVPPDEPQYTLRRVRLTKEEEEGYYYGFANEGLWPLCHIAHTRPIFRAADWNYYRTANQKFAEALLEEMAGTEKPVVLVQDYHFALLPRLVKEQRPDARVAIFWHIPWPNPQAFGICPWQRELLEGLLGADLIGFHIQSHCNFFLETVDQALESRIEWERFAANRRGHLTLVRAHPISVAFAEPAGEASPHGSNPYLERAALLRELGVQATFMGVGVDRVDYTKGIPERFRGVERFLDKYPAYRGRFTFVQIGAPSRTHIKRYHDFLAEVTAEAERINWRFQTGEWKPIVFLNRHHSHKEIEPYYKAADLCLVTSLHDGMNLVAKEYVAARDDEQGALILSRFTGASRELRDALVVNPYDTEQLAEAIHFALEMDSEERKVRMQHMRRLVREHNVYRWAGNLVGELAEIRVEVPTAAPVR